MSLSEQTNTKFMTGKVLMNAGGTGAIETTVAQLEGSTKLTWDESVEGEYLERVKARAATKAKQVLAQAQQEANAIREEARQEGFDQGLAEAQNQLEQARASMAEELAKALESVRQGRSNIWRLHREDVMAVIHLAVEKIIGCEIHEQRRKILGSLLDEAVEALEAERTLTLRANPEDAQDLDDLMNEVRDRYPSMESWRIKPDQNMQPGGLIVETDYGKVDSTLESRRELVESVFTKMNLPSGDVSESDENASANMPEEGHPANSKQAEPAEEPAS